jgi:RHS repeat-associated protein
MTGGARGISRHAVVGVVAALTTVALAAVDGGTPSARASATGGSGAGTPVVGGFGLGDGLEGLIDERDGALSVSVDVAELTLAWDSRSSTEDRYGFGAGWGIGLGRVETEGGVYVSPSSGGRYAADATQPSGLAGYPTADVRFEQVPGGVLPGRPDGARGEVAYGFVLRELGGLITYFSGDGDPVVRVSATGQRSDWAWGPSIPHRLVFVVDELGVATALDWTDPGAVMVRPGENLPPLDDWDAPEWRIELDGGRVASVVDPAGGRTRVGYGASGLVDRLSGSSGAITSVTWQSFDDQVPRVSTLRTMDATGAELSARSWNRGDANLASGWPAVQTPDELVRAASFQYETEVSDGSTRVRSTYGPLHTLQSRVMVASTPVGDLELQSQTFTYPEGADDGDTEPGALPLNWSRPRVTEVTHSDETGATRTLTEQLEYDELGRLATRTQPDGTTIAIEYAPSLPGDSGPPIGLPVLETTTAPDGTVARARHTLTDDGTSLLATEALTGPAGGALTPVGRTEYTVEPDGYISEERVFPGGDPDAEPVVTRHRRSLDLARGELTSSETIAAGSSAEATTTTVTSLRHGGVTDQVDALGNRATATFDALGRPVAETVAGLTATTSYESAEHDGRNATTVTDPAGRAATEIRDPLGRVTAVHDNIDHGVVRSGHVRVAETRAYPEPGLVEVTDAWGAVTSTRQDVFGRTVETVAPGGLTELTRYDDVAATVTKALTPTGRLADAEAVTTEQLDVAGRTIRISGTRADGDDVPATELTYDGLGREVGAHDGFRRVTTTYDPAGNPVETTAAPVVGEVPSASGPLAGAPITATRTFDGLGHSLEKVVASADEGRSGGTRELDALGRTVLERDQLGHATTHEYTIDGLLSETSGPGGRRTRLEYHPVTRTLTTARVTDSDDEVATGLEHDPVTGEITAVFDPRDPVGSRIGSEYDAFGNATRIAYPDGKTISHTYDAHGRLETTTDVAGSVTSRSYTDTGLLATTRQVHADGTTAHVAYTYDRYGRVIRLARGTGSDTTYGFTSAGQVDHEQTTHADGRESERRYSYLPTGNLRSRTDTERDETGAATSTTTSYTYDAHDRLIGSRVHDGPSTDAALVATSEYEVTASGDLRRETVNRPHGDGDGDVSIEREFEYTAVGELIAVRTTTRSSGRATKSTEARQAYDDAGNLVRDIRGATYDHDADGRVTAQTDADGTRTTTRYWADGSRRERTREDATGAETRVGYYWSGDALLNETHTSGGSDAAAPVSYLFGAGRHARTTPAGTQYYEADRHGNIVETTDEHGTRAAAYTYSDYGIAEVTGPEREATGIARNPFQYAGEYTHEDGSQPLGSRTYDPLLMQFTTPDAEPLHNLRAYADLNPIMNVDPSGTSAATDDIVNWIMFGLAIAAAAYSVPTLAAAAPMGAPAIFSFAASVVAAAADAVNLGITSAALIKRYQPHWFGDADTSGLESDELQYAGYGFAAAAAPGALAAVLSRGFTRLANPKIAQNEAFVSELKQLVDHHVAAGRRVKMTKFTKEVKTYYHGTSADGRSKISANGFKAPDGSDHVLYGPGTYLSPDLEVAKDYGTHVARFTPTRIVRAMKVDVFDHGTGIANAAYRLRNPYWTKTSPFWVRKYTRTFASVDEVEAYRKKHAIQAVFIGSLFNASGFRPVLSYPVKYLRIPKATRSEGVLTSDAVSWMQPRYD